jgi:hypothetical protein
MADGTPDDPIAAALEHVHRAFYGGDKRRELELAYMALVFLKGEKYVDRYGKRWKPNDETRVALERAWHALHGQRPDSLLWHEWREIAVRVRVAGKEATAPGGRAGTRPRLAAEGLKAWLTNRYAKQCPELDGLAVSKLAEWLERSVDGERKPGKGHPKIARVMARIFLAVKAKPTLAGRSKGEDSLTRQIADVIDQPR